MKRVSLFFVLLFCIATALIHAEVIPGRWEKVHALDERAPIILDLDGGEKIEAQFLSLEDETILVKDEGGTERRIPKVQIRKISGRDRVIKDSVVDGLAWGALAGGMVGLVPLILFLSEDDLTSEIIGWSALATGVGAGTGLAADALTKSHEVYYVGRSEEAN